MCCTATEGTSLDPSYAAETQDAALKGQLRAKSLFYPLASQRSLKFLCLWRVVPAESSCDDPLARHRQETTSFKRAAGVYVIKLGRPVDEKIRGK